MYDSQRNSQSSDKTKQYISNSYPYTENGSNHFQNDDAMINTESYMNGKRNGTSNPKYQTFAKSRVSKMQRIESIRGSKQHKQGQFYETEVKTRKEKLPRSSNPSTL